MNLGFIVTTYNILPYVGRCLDSLAACARPGDTVIVVDDGSDDGTAEFVGKKLAEAGFDPEVRLRPILFGANTIGGVGIAGNTGLFTALSDQTCDAIFFVDGDDWLEPTGFEACRRAFETGSSDILIANYAEYDERSERSTRPADAANWTQVQQLSPQDTEAARRLALSMIAVPWRKFYRADFLRRHNLSFPEGPFFFEDNPFHWAVCLKADNIAFLDRILCQHRINRPGQTMSSTGTQLVAFFDHYETILSLIPRSSDTTLAETALRWLLNNMSWHIQRLGTGAFWPYASRAARVLAAVPTPVWRATIAKFDGTTVRAVAEALRAGDVPGVVAVWMQTAQATAINGLRSRLDQLSAKTDTLLRQLSILSTELPKVETSLQDPVQQTAAQVAILYEIARFQALASLPDPDPSPETVP